MAEQNTISLVELDDFFVIPKMFYRSVGVTPYKDKKAVSHRAKQVVLFATTFLSINSCLLMQIIDMSSANVMDLTGILCCFLFTLFSQIKIFIILSNRSNVNIFIELMKQQFPLTTKDQVDFDVSSALKNVLRLEKLYIWTVVIGVWCFNLLPLSWSTVEYLLDSSKKFVIRFPYYRWYPFEMDNMWIYLATYIQQAHVGVVAVNCVIASDILLFSAISLIRMYFRYTRNQLKRMVLSGTEDDLVHLKVIMNFHRTTLIIAEMTNTVFSSPLLWTFLSSALTICLSKFQTTAPDVTVIQSVTFFMFFMHELVKTAVICYLGQSLMDYVSQYTNDIYTFLSFNFLEFGGF